MVIIIIIDILSILISHSNPVSARLKCLQRPCEASRCQCPLDQVPKSQGGSRESGANQGENHGKSLGNPHFHD